MSKLDEIVSYKRLEVAELKKRNPLAQVERALKGRPPVRDFAAVIRKPGRLSLIAEIKRASPSAGAIRPGADVLEIAEAYAEAGVQAISVLTDAKFFSGSLEDLIQVREKVKLPVLRKDFNFEEYQMVEAAAAGADAVLLIAAILPKLILKGLQGLAVDLSLAALVEVHTEKELDEALETGAKIIGINNRDLGTFTVDLKTTGRLVRQVPPDRIRVSESGIRSRSDVELIHSHGVDAILVGEELMGSQDIGKRIKELMGW